MREVAVAANIVSRQTLAKMAGRRDSAEMLRSLGGSGALHRGGPGVASWQGSSSGAGASHGLLARNRQLVQALHRRVVSQACDLALHNRVQRRHGSSSHLHLAARP